MAAWFTIYCQRSVSNVTAGHLLNLLRDLEDPHTLAESYGLNDDAAVDRALANLRVVPVTEPEGVKFDIYYKRGKSRPVRFHSWADVDRLQAEREEALEQLEGGQNNSRVRSHLAKCVEVIALELGWNQLEDVGIVFAGQIAEFLAVEGTGLIRDQNDDWWAMKKGAPLLLVGRSNKP